MKKRFLSLVLCMVLVASLFTGFVSTASADDVITYGVHDGDYLFKICKAHGLDYYQCKNAIMILNNFTTETQLNRLTVGQTVKLPASNAVAATVKATSSTTTTVTTSTTVGGKTTTTTSTSTVSGNLSNYNVAFYLIPHVMQYGDTLASVCNTYGTSYGQYSSMLLGANGISNANNIWAGKTVYVPSTKAPAAGGFYAVVNHVVSSGETMTSICNNYGTSYTANATLIKGLNSNKNLNTIYAGQSLYIPVVSSVINTNPNVAPNPTTQPIESGYNISFENTVNGAPYAVINDVKASKADLGKTVTVIPNAKYGFAQEKIEVIRTDSSADVVVTNNKFVMPPCDVVIHIDYKDALAITKTPTKYGSYKTLVNGVEADFAGVNDTVTLAFTTDAGYSCESAQYTPEGGSAVAIKQSSDGSWSFAMPNKKVTIEVTFSRDGNLYALKKSIVDDKGNAANSAATVSFEVNGTGCTKAAKNTQVTAVITPKANYSIKSIEMTAGGNPVTYSKSDATHYVFKMPANEVTVKVTVTYSKAFALNDISGKNGTIVFTDDEGRVISSAKIFDVVHVLLKPASWYEYAADSLLVTYLDKKTKISTNKISDNEYTFVMAGTDVCATATWNKAEKAQGTVKCVSSKNGDYDVWVTPVGGSSTRINTALVGETVQIRVQGHTGYVCTSLIAYQEHDSSKTNLITSYSYWDNNPSNISSGSFVMPAGDNICFEATFSAEAEYVTIKNYGDGGDKQEGIVIAEIGGKGMWDAKVGVTFDFVYHPNDGYRITSMKLYKASTNETVDLALNNNRASYTMTKWDYNSDPAKNYIEIIPTFEVSDEFSINQEGSGFSISPSSTTYTANQTITLTATSGNEFDEAALTLYTGSESDGSRKDITDYEISSDKTTITFKMPAANVYVKTDTVVTPTYTITWNEDSSKFTFGGSNPTTSAANQVVEFTITPDSSLAYGTDYNTIAVTYNGAPAEYVSNSGSTDPITWNYKFTTVGSDASVDVTIS